MGATDLRVQRVVGYRTRADTETTRREWRGMSEQRLRARALGIEIGIYPPGPENAITDVAGVEVGQTTVAWGDASLSPGQGPARTGVTAIWPQRDDLLRNPVAAGFFALSGTGEMTARSEIEEQGR